MPTFAYEAMNDAGKGPTMLPLTALVVQALIDCGEAALVPLLNALVAQADSTWLREGAHHVFSSTRSLKVQQVTADVVKALKGPASSVATTEAAVRALVSMQG